MKQYLAKGLKLIVACAVVICLLSIVTAHLPFILISGSSMEPTYSDNQMVYLNKGNEDIKRGDVIIFKQKVHFAFEEKLIKRVCGVPGDQIYKDKDDNYFVYDGKNVFYYDKQFEDTTTLLQESTFLYFLNEDQFFCMGDNRKESVDSRTFGAIDKNKITACVKDGYIEPKTL